MADLRGEPEIERILKATRTLRAWKKQAARFFLTVELGKMSPEARRFAAHRVAELADKVRELLTRLEARA